MLQRFCLWKWLAVGIALATVLAGSLAQNDEGKAFAVGGRGCFLFYLLKELPYLALLVNGQLQHWEQWFQIILNV